VFRELADEFVPERRLDEVAGEGKGRFVGSPPIRMDAHRPAIAVMQRRARHRRNTL
jgi:hypothetical protein